MPNSPALTDEEKDFAREYVAEAVGEDERKARRKEIAEEFGVSIMTIAAITAWTTIRANKAIRGESNPIMESDEAHEDIPENDESRRRGGEHFNYDSTVKAAWRKRMREFVEGNTTRQERERMKALMLPGVQCTEAEMYLDMGFQPRNITGVEGGDKDAREQFSRNATKLGINVRLGRLENILPNDTTRYGVVSLDFLGQLCVGYMKILRNVLMEKRGMLLTNMMAKREKKDVQMRLQGFASMDSEHGVFGRIARSGLMETFTGMLARMKSAVFPSLATLRDQKAWIEICMNAGQERAENKPYAELIDQIPTHFAGGMQAYTEYLSRLVIATQTAQTAFKPITELISKIYPTMEHVDQLEPNMTRMVAIGMGQLPDVRTHEAYMYTSMAGRTPIPYYSDFFVLERQTEAITEMRHTIRFLLEHIVDALKVGEEADDKYEVGIRDKRGRLYEQPQQEARSSDRISARLHTGKSVDLTIGRMLGDMRKSLELGSTSSVLSGDMHVTRKEIVADV